MYENLGRMLRQLRKDRGETLEQVATATGLSIAMLSRLERGERLPSPDSIEALSAHFLIEPDELLGQTIANRIHSRYGDRGTEVAAERFRSDAPAATPFPGARLSQRPRRSVAGFSAMGIEAFESLDDADSGLIRVSAPSGPPAESAAAWELVHRSLTQAIRTYTREAEHLSPEERMELVHAIDQIADETDALLESIAATDDDRSVQMVARKVQSLRRSRRR